MSRIADQGSRPGDDGGRQFIDHLGSGTPSALDYAERMIGSLDGVERRSGLEVPAHLGDQIRAGETVPRALEKEHWQMYLLQVLGSAGSWLSWRVQRKTEEGQSLYSRQRTGCCGARRHSSTQRLPTRNHRQLGYDVFRFADCRPNAFFQKPWGVRTAPARFHVRKLETKSGNPARRQ